MTQKFTCFFVVIGIIAAMTFSRTDTAYAAALPAAKVSQQPEKVYPFAECPVKPKFQNGDQNEFTKWVFNEIVYPPDAMKSKVQGRVTLQFTINTDGTVSDVKVLRGVDENIDKEAVRVVSKSPVWEPGRDKDGNPVKVRMTFPVIFQLR